jgi:hypothetical protein
MSSLPHNQLSLIRLRNFEGSTSVLFNVRFVIFLRLESPAWTHDLLDILGTNEMNSRRLLFSFSG